MRPAAKILLALIVSTCLAGALGAGILIGSYHSRTQMAVQEPVTSTQPVIPSATEPSIAPASDQPSSEEAPYGAEDDGPGPGYDGERYIDPEEGAPLGPNLPAGLDIHALGGEPGESVQLGQNQTILIQIYLENDCPTDPIPGGSRFRIKLCDGLVPMNDSAAATVLFSIDGTIASRHILDLLLGEGITVPRLMPHSSKQVMLTLMVADDFQPVQDGKLYAFLEVRGPTDNQWYQTQVMSWWY